jgi:hypothetical protein
MGSLLFARREIGLVDVMGSSSADLQSPKPVQHYRRWPFADVSHNLPAEMKPPPLFCAFAALDAHGHGAQDDPPGI